LALYPATAWHILKINNGGFIVGEFVSLRFDTIIVNLDFDIIIEAVFSNEEKIVERRYSWTIGSWVRGIERHAPSMKLSLYREVR
jgi:hypothetical protein